MHYLLIDGMTSRAGPGDVMGVLTSSTALEGSDIGNIEFSGDGDSRRATVEIHASPRDYDTSNIDRVGPVEVRVSAWTQEEYEKLDRYITGFSQLVQMEREEEMRRHRREIENLTGREREEAGRALLEMKGKEEGEDLGGKTMVKFTRSGKSSALPDMEISVGDLVMISKYDPLRDDNPTGTVARKTNYSITVAFSSPPHGFVYDRDLRIDLYVNDITFQRMLEALEELPFHPRKELVKALLGIASVSPTGREDIAPRDPDLNDDQKLCVERALAADTFFCIHGPPGTGKTTTLVEAIAQLVARGQDVLASADSNAAVDNLVEFLKAGGLNPVRVGHPARINPILRETSLDYQVQDHPKYKKSRELRDEAFDLKEEQESKQIPSGRYRRGLSDGQIHSLARKGAGARGVSSKKIKQMSRWLRLQEEIDELFEESRELEEEAIEEILSEADVVCTTNSTAGSDILADKEYDVAVVDEATQAIEPSCLISCGRAEKVIMAGDHRQLPPTVLNQECEDQLQRTLFERLVEREGEKITEMLRVQYRMHEKIMNFPSEQFYDGNLEADPAVEKHTLADLGFQFEGGSDLLINKALNPDWPVVFIDTELLQAPERQRSGSTSRENRAEVEVVTNILEGLLGEMDPENIGVISPYDDQVDLLSARVDSENLEVKTVDGFQGREKEVILLSFVRSNERDELGFLTDLRRLNVSITRARRKLIMVGDSSTLSDHPVYEDLLDYVREEGAYLVPEEMEESVRQS